MKLSDIKAGEKVFVDSNIFIYHFTGVSKECLDFFKRCEAKDILAITGTTIIAEVCHRLMIAEAISRGFISAARPALQLQKKPALVKQLHEYYVQITNITGLGIAVINTPENIITESQVYRTQFGLLTNDSFVPVYMKTADTDILVTNDKIFGQIPNIHIYAPSDI